MGLPRGESETTLLPAPPSLCFKSLTVYKTLKVGRVSITLNVKCGDGVVNGLQIVRCQLHVCATKILL
jgi:hypothetical protein